MNIKEEIAKGFLRGIGFILSLIFISILIGLIIWLVIEINANNNSKQCISWDYINGNKVCTKYK